MKAVHAAYEQQWLTLAEEYHDRVPDLARVQGLAGPDTPVDNPDTSKESWAVRMFRWAILLA